MKESTITTKYIAKPRLKELLSERDDIETYQQFADMVGVKKSTISRFDKQGRYDINTLISIIKVLDCTVDELFDIEFNEDYVMRETEKAANMAVNQENLEHFCKNNFPTKTLIYLKRK